MLAAIVAGCSGSADHRSPSAAPKAKAKAVSHRITRATAQDIAWLGRLEKWGQKFGRAFDHADVTYEGVLGGTRTKVELRVALRPLVRCPTSLARHVGAPPTARYSSTYTLLVRACRSQRRYALAVTRSFKRGQASALQQVEEEGGNADTFFEQAYMELDKAMLANRRLPVIGGRVTRSRIEPRFSQAASVIAHRKVEIRCWSRREWRSTLKEYGAVAGRTDLAGFAQPPGRASLWPESCAVLVGFVYRHRRPPRGAALEDAAFAVALLAHETEHLVSAGGSEAETECYGMQDIRWLARGLGANRRYAALLAETYWARFYPYEPEGYGTKRCRNSGPLDAHPKSDVWP